ncbi:VanZ family protein [Pallidibacillus pasinlerensis]|uniref:VanZ family protein n=1 Tax=Pallidibacillus pasinlerensis TaxID=2703818 RepID=A0ABX0A3H8_9BACI|nr:VanZ family protein [Pallidibacillus pasinlerensis]NCU17387.1 VanZ family protein [Pallidibacillus pasinlerensis]
MEQIIGYTFDMLPFLLVMLPIYVFVRGIYLFRNKKGQSIQLLREFGLLLFVLYLTGVASQTIVPEFVIINNKLQAVDLGFNPDRINLEPFNKIIETQILVENGHISYLFIEVFGNICMFIPIGFFLPLLWDKFKNPFLTVFVCLFISFSIETIQLILPRGTDVDDIILNTSGGLIGYILYSVQKSRLKNITIQV